MALAVDRYGFRRVCVCSGSFGDNDLRMIDCKFTAGRGVVRGFQKEKERESARKREREKRNETRELHDGALYVNAQKRQGNGGLGMLYVTSIRRVCLL